MFMGLLLALLTSCSSEDSVSAGDILEELPGSFFESSEISQVKNGTVKACPYATLGDMADAFFDNPRWSDFPSSSGGTVVELSGELTYSGLPATALIQFDVYGSTFEASYLGINDIDQNLLVLSALLTKMCEAV
jgi:hypothetical protein